MHALKSLIFILALGATIFSTDAAEFAKIGRKNYFIERNMKLNWHEAWDYCAVNNMKLITIETDLDARLLKELIGTKPFNFWTSGNENANPTANNKERRFVWAANGRPFTYTNWGVGEPNNSGDGETCVATGFLNLTWNDESCHQKYYFICEY